MKQLSFLFKNTSRNLFIPFAEAFLEVMDSMVPILIPFPIIFEEWLAIRIGHPCGHESKGSSPFVLLGGTGHLHQYSPGVRFKEGNMEKENILKSDPPVQINNHPIKPFHKVSLLPSESRALEAYINEVIIIHHLLEISRSFLGWIRHPTSTIKGLQNNIKVTYDSP